MRNNEGAIIGAIHIARDITEQKRLEETLRDSKAKYQAIFESTGTATLIVEEDTTILMANNECYSVTGYTPAELIGQKWVQYVAPESLQKMLKNQELRRQNPELAPKKYEVKLVNKKGEIRDALLDISPIQGTEQSVVSILDITKQKQAEQNLRESEKHFETLFDLSVDPVVIVDKKGKFLEITVRVEDITGFKREDLIGKTFLSTKLVSTRAKAILIKNLAKRMMGMHIAPYEVEILSIDGKKMPFEINAAKIDYKGAQADMVVFRDINARKQAEKEIKRKNEELLLVNAEKDKFFSIIAHDLKSPFNSFLGFTQMMAEQVSELNQDQIQKIAVSMRKSATNLYGLLENLLEWSRMQQGITAFNPEPLSLMPKISGSLALYQESFKSKKIDISYDISEDLTVSADGNMFESIVRNLVYNAIKFTPQEGKIAITAKSLDDNWIETSVKDSGIGMNKEIVENLFKLDADTSRKGTNNEPSTGLGLIICKDFVEKHGRKLWVESEEGIGSTFHFTLPARASN